MKTNLAKAVVVFSCLLAASNVYASDDIQHKFDALQAKSIISEQPLDNGISRAELAVVLMRTYQLAPSAKAGRFTDLSGHWLSGTRAAETMLEKGWMTGKSDTSFNPDDPVTKKELAVILSRAGHMLEQDWSKNEQPATRKDLIEALYDIIQDEQLKLRIVRTKVISSNSVEVTFSDRKVQTFTVPELTPGRATSVEVTYQDQPFSFIATYMGDDIDKIAAMKTRLNVRAGEIEKDKLTYQLYNTAGQLVPLPSDTKIVVKSSDPHISSDGWFDNRNDPTPAGSTVTYTIDVVRNNKVMLSVQAEATVYESAEGYKPTVIRFLSASSNKTWGYSYITMQNDDQIEPKVRLIVTKAVDPSGETIDRNTGKNEEIAEEIGDLSFYTTDERIAQIDQNGVITPIAPGQVGLIVISGDYEFKQTIYVYPAQIPTTSVYNVKYITKSDRTIIVKLKDQYGQTMRTAADANRFRIRTMSGKSDVVDLSNAKLEIRNNQLFIQGAQFFRGEDQLIVSYDGNDLGVVTVIGEESR